MTGDEPTIPCGKLGHDPERIVWMCVLPEGHSGECSYRQRAGRLDPQKETLRSLVGYEHKLWKMKRARLIQEAEAFGVATHEVMPKSLIIRRILLARGADDQTLF